MQCTMVPGIDYLNVYSQLHEQKLALLRVIDSRISCSQVYPDYPVNRTHVQTFRYSWCNWSWMEEELAQLAKIWLLKHQPKIKELVCIWSLNPCWMIWFIIRQLAISSTKPVDPAEVPWLLVRHHFPMDLSTMSKQLESEHYKSISEFTADLKLIADNCRKYNDPDTTYYKNANILENFYFEKLKSART